MQIYFFKNARQANIFENSLALTKSFRVKKC